MGTPRLAAGTGEDSGTSASDQAMWIFTVVHDSTMHGGAAGIVRRPVDNRQMLLRQLGLRLLDDPHLRSFWSCWTLLGRQLPPKKQHRQYDRGYVPSTIFPSN